MDTAVRSEQLTVSRVRHGPELYGKTIRIDDDPSTLFVGAPARTRQADGRGYVGRAGLGRGITATTSEANPAQCALIRTTPSRMKMVISGSRAMSADTVRLPATGASSCVNMVPLTDRSVQRDWAETAGFVIGFCPFGGGVKQSDVLADCQNRPGSGVRAS